MSLTAVILIFISTFIHAGWNLLVRSQRTNYIFLRIAGVISCFGLGPALMAEFWGTRFPPQVWFYLLVAGTFTACYYLGLTQGYQYGDFTVVYPIARALPILLVAMVDVVRGYTPSSIGWLGMGLVFLGGVITPLHSLRNFRLADYWNRTMGWVIITALATVGYTTVDNAAAELIPPGPFEAVRYGIFEFSISALVYWLILKGWGKPTGDVRDWAGWKWAFIGAGGVFGAYWLVLWSYQLSPQASYVVALRQFSIVIGVISGTFLFGEPARVLRIIASLIIALGVAGIALAG